MPYSFDTILLSAQKYSNPPLVGAALSANGVNVISLSHPDVGVAFNKKTTLNNYLSTFTLYGTVLRIDTAYHNTPITLVKAPVNNITSYVVVPYLSTSSNVTAQSLTAVVTTTDVSNPQVRRKYLLGYM